MRFFCTPLVLWCWACGVLVPGEAAAQNRRTSPGLVLQTGGRHAPCDVLLFSPGGEELLAAGDDKVVRIWGMSDTSIQINATRILRWPIFREQRGGIFAMALSPQDRGRQVAVAGFGLITGLVAILDRHTGAMLHVLDRPLSAQVTTALAWSPDGKYLVWGSADGELFRWEPEKGSSGLSRFAGTPQRGNRIRFLGFLANTQLLSVTNDGVVQLHEVTDPGAEATELGAFSRGHVIRVALSPDRRWLVAASQNVSGEMLSRTQEVEFLELRELLAGRKAAPRRLSLPQPETGARFPTDVAFDTTSEYLAVGFQQAHALPAGTRPFARVTGGGVFVWSMRDDPPRLVTRAPLATGYTVDALAFRPAQKGNPDTRYQLAVAGGPDHEVRLFDLRKTSALSEVKGEGSSLWSVAMSADRKYLAWKNQLNTNPSGPNDRGTGPWQVFTLDRSPSNPVRRILPQVPVDFTPTLPLERLGEWSVETTTSGFLWYVRGPAGMRVPLHDANGLYLTRVNQIPRCYTFLKPIGSKPARLAVGHQWGVSLYELRERQVKLARLMVGHEGEVMAVAPSPDGKLLLSAGRDQTLACWSLEDWPDNPELGAVFVTRGGKVLVKKVHPGSPAWEAGLTEDDEITMVVSRDPTGSGGVVFDPEEQGLKKHGFVLGAPRLVNRPQILEILNRAEPNREYIFVWRHAGREQKQLTTVRQRPLWRFLPTRTKDWVLWRWRDYFYDASGEADRLLGWQVNPASLRETPEYYPLAQFSSPPVSKRKQESRRNPDRVWKFVKLPFQEPEKVLFPEIEPPEVRLRVLQKPVRDPAGDRPLRLQASVRPRSDLPQQKVSRVTLWLDDYRFENPPRIDAKTGIVEEIITIPLSRLRQGSNRITLTAFNEEGGRSEATLTVEFIDQTRRKPNLYALCVGINDYRGVRGFQVSDLNCSTSDARAIQEVLQEHENSKLFTRAITQLLTDRQATRANIETQLRLLGKQAVARDDWLILFLSGHGEGKETENAYEPGSFFYICADSDAKRPSTLLHARNLEQILSDLPCHKLILLDSCRSGSVVSDPVHDLSPERRFLIFAACKPEQQANEPNLKQKNPLLKGLEHGFFTEGILTALGKPDPRKRHPRKASVTFSELTREIEVTIEDLLLRLKQPRDSQTPVFFPDPRKSSLRDLELLCKP